MQSDVETIHNLMETEFYEIESFQNRHDFICKAASYQLSFNLHRPNSYKEHKTPWQLAKDKKPDLDQRLLMIPPVDLDKLLSWKIDLTLSIRNFTDTNTRTPFLFVLRRTCSCALIILIL